MDKFIVLFPDVDIHLVNFFWVVFPFRLITILGTERAGKLNIGRSTSFIILAMSLVLDIFFYVFEFLSELGGMRHCLTLKNCLFQVFYLALEGLISNQFSFTISAFWVKILLFLDLNVIHLAS